MRVALYGNNLNAGYFITRMLNQAGIETRLFCRSDYAAAQETHHWWTSVERDPRIVREVPAIRLDRPQSLASFGAVRQLYEEVAKYDVLLFSEDGPAVFSELQGPKKVLWSWGWDLQNLPFILSQSLSWWNTTEFLKKHLRAALHGDLRSALLIPYRTLFFPRYLQGLRLVQQRQRLGLTQCAKYILGPHTENLVDILRLDRKRIRYMMMPMDPHVLAEVDEHEISRLRNKFAGIDLVILHPTRQLYLKLDTDPYLKDNHKLIHAYSLFVQRTTRTSKLLLIRKGRQPDIRNSDRLIRRLGIGDRVEWLQEMPNRILRAYYCLPNVVVCDQFCPRLPVLGNTGREATFYGRPLITSFTQKHRLIFGDDLPANVFSADTVNEILESLLRIEQFSESDYQELANTSRAWFARQLSPNVLVNRISELLREVVDSAGCPGETES